MQAKSRLQRTVLASAVAFMTLPVAVALMGFASVSPRPPAAPAGVHKAKLAFSYLTPEQVTDLWKRADEIEAAERESLDAYVAGLPSNFRQVRNCDDGGRA